MAGSARVEQLTGAHVVREALRARRRKLFRLRVAGRADPEILAEAEAAGVPVESVPPHAIREAGEGGNPQRVALEAGPLPEARLEDLWSGAAGSRRIVVLDEVEDPHNFGAIARVADAAGALGIVVGTRRSAPLSPAASRASAGALEWLPVVRVPNLPRSLKQLKEKGFWVVGADADGPESLFAMPDKLLSGDLVVALGAEGRGLRPGMLELVDHRVRIPMLGRVASLNVSTAGAVVLFDLVRRSRA